MPRQRPSRSCPRPECPSRGAGGASTLVRHGFFLAKGMRRRRWRCTSCGHTSSSNTGTAYHRIQRSRRTFDTVAALSVEGVSKSAIARVMELSWNTVARWQERASRTARRFNDEKLRGFDLLELQADEIRAFVGAKDRTTWIFATLEVSSRLWPATVMGRRVQESAHEVIRDTLDRGVLRGSPLVTTDGFRCYPGVIWRLLGARCIHGQVIKLRRNDRVVKVDRRLVVGTRASLDEALIESEDSERLNTSFIERLNLTIRQSCAYLGRRVLAHARSGPRLQELLELVRCSYNFVRRHRALKFGREMRTPAMQAGLTSRRLVWRQIFTSSAARPLPLARVFGFPGREAPTGLLLAA